MTKELTQYLTKTGVERLLGLKRTSLKRVYMPEPDAETERGTPLWTPETIAEWRQNRPGTGARTDLDRK